MLVIAGGALIDFMAAPDGRYQPVADGAPFNFARALALQGVAASYANPLSSDNSPCWRNRPLWHSSANRPMVSQATSFIAKASPIAR